MSQGPVLFAYDGSTHAKAAIEHAGNVLQHGPAVVATAWGSFRAGAPAALLAMSKEMVATAIDTLDEAGHEAAEVLAAEGIDATVWDVRVVPLDPELLADAAEHPVVLTAEDGIRDGGVGALIADAISRIDSAGPSPRVRVLGTPIAYIPHAKPDAILADLGLDAAGLAAEARALVAALRP